mgnify:CR=1 FL=1
MIHIIKSGGNVSFHGSSYESRGDSFEKLVRASLEKYPVDNEFSITVGMSDRKSSCDYDFHTDCKDYDRCFPDPFFHSWPETGMRDYSELVKSFRDNEPNTNKIGWVGNKWTHPDRIEAFAKALDINCCDFREISWVRDGEDYSKATSGYMSYQDQIDEWKYLIDLPANGWSGRTKVLMSSPRILFIVEQEYEEFWHKELEPWKHYVPVKRDVSDLEENYNKIESDPGLQDYIKKNQREFAKKHLTQESALFQINKILKTL